GVFYQNDRPTKNALEKKWIETNREKTGNDSDLELLQKTFDRMKRVPSSKLLPLERFDLMESPLKEQLRALLQKKSVCHGEFTLASGAKSDFYVDARVTTLDPRGACLIGEVGWELVKKTGSKLGKHVDAIGGLTLGADPVALSIGIAAQRQDPSNSLQVFTVRKAAKEHGRQRRIE